MTRSTLSKSYRGVPSVVLAIHAEDVVEDGVRPDRLDAELARGRSGTPARAPRPRGSPPGPSPRRSSARCSEPIIGRHGRWTGAGRARGVDDDAHLGPRARSGAGLTGADNRADRRVDARTGWPPRRRCRPRRPGSCRRTARGGRRGRRRPCGRSASSVALAPSRGGRGSRRRPRPATSDTVTWPRPRSARTSVGGGRATSGAGGRARSTRRASRTRRSAPTSP